MIIRREIKNQIKKELEVKKRAVIIYGPRQSGKTTLIKMITSKLKNKPLFFNGDDLYAQEIFSRHELENLKRIVGDNKLLIIDEAQRIENIGLSLKLLIDNLKMTILISGSSSFDLSNRINEPLTGRTKTFFLYPFSYQELEKKYRQTKPKTILEEMLRFGMYPKVHTLGNNQEKENYLYELLNNYLYKDILIFEQIRKPKKVIDLLTLLALQIGKEVSIDELTQNLALTRKAVEGYLDLLEKMFVIINLKGFSRNLRKEISKTSKYYFIDLGLRNALLRNFNSLHLRQDKGELFENWFIVERIKSASNSNKPANFYFWRTYDQQEIDLIEERGGRLLAFECKWSKIKHKAPPDWLKTYKNSKFKMINADNFGQYLK